MGIVQTGLYQHQREANLALHEEILADLPPGVDLVVLQEMFNTGYTVDPQYAEADNQQTVKWLMQLSLRTGAALTGSIMWREGPNITNRALLVQHGTIVAYYDKHHLFSYAGEHQYLQPGTSKQTWLLNGWRIRPVICYDLRFPEWLRRTSADDVDLYIIPANWPASRLLAWETLLKARAIENQTYVIGVNRGADPEVGTTTYSGGSAIISYEGHLLSQQSDQTFLQVVKLSKNEQEAFRLKFPFWLDSEGFSSSLDKKS